jgi:DNA-binding SARP family transcriptional activator
LALKFRILGPLEVDSESGPVVLAGIKLRVVLVVLLLHPNESVHAERLALALWGQDAPATAAKTVQVYVSRLRKALGDPDILATAPAGYRLRVRAGELDAEHFARLVEDGRRALDAGQAEHAAAVLREALALWRGPPLAELTFEPFAQAEIARLQEQRLTALEVRVDADLAAGRHRELVGELRQLVSANPTRERLAAQLMLALYRCGQQVDALEAFHTARRVLLSGIGVEPGPQLRRLQQAILRHDPTLEPQQAVVELPRELDAATAPPLVGRDAELARLRVHWERARTGTGALVAVIGARGIGKSRVMGELAGEAHRRGSKVLYAAGTGPAHSVLAALTRTREARRPTLLVVDDADQAGSDVLAELDELTRLLPAVPVLLLASATDTEALAHFGADALTLGPLDAEAVRAITVRYAPHRAHEDVPAEWLLQSSGGVCRRVHEVAAQWAHWEAARRVGDVAERTAAGRAQLRSMESELTGNVVALQAAREGRPLDGDGEAPVMCPFKGLASFDVADAAYFFGRERLIAELVTRLVGAPLLGVVGPSGSGKSSAVRAGLLAALAGGVLPGSEQWTQIVIRPGEHPLNTLRDAIDSDSQQRLVLAIDQFEETFTACRDPDERASFIAKLTAVAADPGRRYVVVLTIRADFYGRCAAYPQLSSLLAANHVLVGPMGREELRHAIEGPAARADLRIEPELVQALIDDVADEPGALPLLSTALLELWQRRDGRHLRHAAYQQTGGVRGAVGRLAEDAFGQLDGPQQTVARSVLLRLVAEGASGTVERRRTPLTELDTEDDADAGRVISLLTDCRLLTISTGTVEVAHEALLREWSRLRDWIEEDREGLRIHRRLTIAACEWQRLGHDTDALYRGNRLTEATEWQTQCDPPLSILEREFLEASEASRRDERRVRRVRIRLAFSGVTIALAAITAAAVVALYQGRETERQRDIAVSRESAANAVHMREALSVTSPLKISSGPWPTATFKVTNVTDKAVTIPYFAVAGRSAPDAIRDFPSRASVTLRPGHTYTYRASRELPAGDYMAWPCLFDGVGWHDLGGHTRFTVR